ncbi:hypothetical protein CRYUN_Cryun05aG0025800 [Craigia yunnanensis]
MMSCLREVNVDNNTVGCDIGLAYFQVLINNFGFISNRDMCALSMILQGQIKVSWLSRL